MSSTLGIENPQNDVTDPWWLKYFRFFQGQKLIWRNIFHAVNTDDNYPQTPLWYWRYCTWDTCDNQAMLNSADKRNLACLYRRMCVVMWWRDDGVINRRPLWKRTMQVGVWMPLTLRIRRVFDDLYPFLWQECRWCVSDGVVVEWEPWVHIWCNINIAHGSVMLCKEKWRRQMRRSKKREWKIDDRQINRKTDKG